MKPQYYGFDATDYTPCPEKKSTVFSTYLWQN